MSLSSLHSLPLFHFELIFAVFCLWLFSVDGAVSAAIWSADYSHRIVFEYVMLRDVNDEPAAARCTGTHCFEHTSSCVNLMCALKVSIAIYFVSFSDFV